MSPSVEFVLFAKKVAIDFCYSFQLLRILFSLKLCNKKMWVTVLVYEKTSIYFAVVY